MTNLMGLVKGDVSSLYFNSPEVKNYENCHFGNPRYLPAMHPRVTLSCLHVM